MTREVRHPLTVRDRLYLTGRMHFVRGRQVDPAARVSIDNVIVDLAGRCDPTTGRPSHKLTIGAHQLPDLERATRALERLIRQDERRDSASVDDQAALGLLRRVRNAARRADRARPCSTPAVAIEKACDRILGVDADAGADAERTA